MEKGLKKPSMKILKNVLPWLVALGIFFYLFHKYDPKQIWASLQVVILPIFIPFSILYFTIFYFVDIFSLSKVLHRFGYTVTVRELVPVRGVTYLLMVLNYTAGQGAFAYYLKKPIYILNDVPKNMIYTEEIQGVRPIILRGDLRKIRKTHSPERSRGVDISTH